MAIQNIEQELGVKNAVSALTPAEKRHLGALEKRIERGISTFVEVGESLMEIRDNRLYRDSYATFDAYCRARWNFDRGRAYQLIGAAEVARAIPDGFPPIGNEAQARELVPLVRENPALVQEVWKEVMASDEPLSQSRIRAAVRAHITQPQAHPVSPTAVFLADVRRTTNAAEKWMATRPSPSDRRSVREAVDGLVAAVT